MDTTSLWLHNKLGTANDSSWTSGSICSQLNKDVLKNIKECFPDLQTQVKLKLLLSFFHIPRRMVEEVRCPGHPGSAVPLLAVVWNGHNRQHILRVVVVVVFFLFRD